MKTQVTNSTAPHGRRRGERGMVLAFVLIMLAVMTIIGVLALSTSTTELGISGNLWTQQQAYRVAERAIEYSMTNQDIYLNIGSGTIALTNGNPAVDTAFEADIKAGTNARLREQAGDVNEVRFLNSGPLPPGSGSDPTIFQARYYAVSATGEGPGRANARIESQFVRVVPK